MKRWIKKIYAKIYIYFLSKNLNKLAKYYGTDKWGVHHYTTHYNTYFRSLRKKNLSLLEIGVGGYQLPDSGGQSLRMWKAYFPKASIFSIDIYDKSQLEEPRIKIFQGSQVDRDFLINTVIKQTGQLNIIIDDGSHINEHVIETFTILFPYLKENGIYVIEDTQTSYWESSGGSMDNSAPTLMNFFKNLADGINYAEFPIPGYQPNYTDLNITSIHFYHNLIFIFKGENSEKSNYVHEGVLKL